MARETAFIASSSSVVRVSWDPAARVNRPDQIGAPDWIAPRRPGRAPLRGRCYAPSKRAPGAFVEPATCSFGDIADHSAHVLQGTPY
jgi:hypothetical protein